MMDRKEKLPAETWANCTSAAESQKKILPENPSFSNFCFQQSQQKWEDSSMLDYGISIESPFQEFNQLPESKPGDQNKILDGEDVRFNETVLTNNIQDWDPRIMLTNLSFLEQKIHQLQDLVHMIVSRGGQIRGQTDELVAQQQQLVTADLTSIIVQLISTADSLLPSAKNALSTATPSIGQLGQLAGILCPSGAGLNSSDQLRSRFGNKVSDQSNQMDFAGNCGTQHNSSVEELVLKDEEDADDREHLPPGSYEILQLEKEEILAPHTHFCNICGKGFKRDANLRMHMRGHGDEYKTIAALAKPNKESSSEPVLIKRYSCPFAGCKRNREHKKFQPLKTILCVKNHYKRTHCDKSYTCSRCHTKKFSVIADLKTHEKHCGKDKWLCSCGTTFSRKDKLFGHIALFQGHTPAIPPDETKTPPAGSSDKGNNTEAAYNLGSTNFSFGSNNASGSETQNIMDTKCNADDPTGFFSPLNIDSCNFGGFHEFPRPQFDDTESSFSFPIAAACNYNQKAGEPADSNNLC